MKVRIKWIYGVLAVTLIFFVLVVSALLYVRHNPTSLKDIALASARHYLGLSVTIKQFSYSLEPLSLDFRDIRIEPRQEGRAFTIDIPQLLVLLAFKGRFGDRTLIIEKIRLVNPSAHLGAEVQIGRQPKDKPEKGFLVSLLMRVFRYLTIQNIEFRAAELGGGRLEADFEGQKLIFDDMEGKLGSDLSCGIVCSAEVKWDQIRSRLSAPCIAISSEPFAVGTETLLKGAIKVEKALFENSRLRVENIHLESKISFEKEMQQLGFDAFHLELNEVSVPIAENARYPSLDAEFIASGSYSIGEKALEISGWQLDLKDLLQLSGTAFQGRDQSRRYRIEIREGEVLPANLLEILPKTHLPNAAVIDFDGGIRVSGHVSGLIGQWLDSLNYSVMAEFHGNRLSVASSDSSCDGLLSGFVKTEGRRTQNSSDIRLDIEKGRLRREGINMSGLAAQFQIEGTHPMYRIRKLTAHFPQTPWLLKGKTRLIESLSIPQGKGGFDLRNGKWSVTECNIHSPALGDFRLTCSGAPELLEIGLRSEELQLGPWAGAIGLIPDDWDISGSGVLDIGIVRTNPGLFEINSGFRLTTLGFNDPNMGYTGQGIGLAAKAEGLANLQKMHMNGSLSVQLQEGEVLLDRFYLNLGRRPVTAMLQGNCNFLEKTLRVAGFHGRLHSLLSVASQGVMSQNKRGLTGDFSLKIEETEFAPLYEVFLKDPYRTIEPLLEELDVSGLFAADLRIGLNRGEPFVKGSVRFRKGRIELPSQNLMLSGISLELPLWVQTKGNRDVWEPIRGGLRVESVDIPLLPKQAVDLQISSGPNVLTIPSAIDLMAPGGGRMRMGPLYCVECPGRDPKIRTSLSFESVELGEALTRFWQRPTRFFLDGELNPVELEARRVRTSGTLKAEAFGGKLYLSKIGLSGIAAGAPMLALDVRWEDLDMEELTAGTDFGKIQGNLKGYIKNLQIAYGQPQRFELFMETVKKKGVPQRISVTAVDNIAQIGGGSSPFGGIAGAFVSMVKEFPYKKIGMRASLENDVFTINGTVKEGGKEYLVRRSGIAGVNVVNQNPDNRIRFKDMLKRIKRIGASKGGPVVQ
jgi:hypothetical protein